MGEKSGYLPYPKGFKTSVCHYAQEPEKWTTTHSIVPPISTSVSFKLLEIERDKNKYITSPVQNPTRECLEALMARLENAKYAACFSSGSAATATCYFLLNKNDHIICSDEVYGGTRKQFTKILPRFGMEVSFADIRPENLEAEIKPNTKMIWVESVSNPCLKVADIAAISKVAKKHNLLFVVDNTFLSPFLHRSLDFGADISMQSITKYINGHTDVLMGALSTNNPALYEKIRVLQITLGTIPSPFDCYQVLRGLKTLPFRIKAQAKSSLKIAKFLESHHKIERVIHPGLPNHPGYDILRKQASGYSGMLAIYLKGDAMAVEKFLSSLKVFALAGSLGGFESVFMIPARTSHASLPADLKKKMGYTDNFLRISVGLEDTDDLVDDLKNALDAI